MKKRSRNGSSETIGLDLGDKYTMFCVLDREGTVVKRGRVATSESALQREFGKKKRTLIALEVGTHSPWVTRTLEGFGHEVVVANPRRVQLIAAGDNKTDDVDAEFLARLARMDVKLLAPVRHRSAQTQQDLAVLRARETLVRSRAMLVNHVRGILKSFGIRVQKCSTPAFATHARKVVPENLQKALIGVLDSLEELGKQIRGYDRRIAQMCREEYSQATKHVQQVKGVGPVVGLAYVLVVEDPQRFARSRAVGSYLGLRPKRRQSGRSDPELRITKAGDGFMRHLLVNSAQYILGRHGPDTDLRRWGLRLAGRGGKKAKKRAVVAVARKLAVLLHSMWKNEATYVPLRESSEATLRRA